MMNAKAYILIEVKAGQTSEVVIGLNEPAGVRSVDAITGPYDVIATVETADQRGIGRLVMDELQQLPGIKRTITCVVIT